MRRLVCLAVAGVALFCGGRLQAKENVITWGEGSRQQEIVLEKLNPEELKAYEEQQHKKLEEDKDKAAERELKNRQEEIQRELDAERRRSTVQSQRLRDLEARQRELEIEQENARAEARRREQERERELERAYFMRRSYPPQYPPPAYYPHSPRPSRPQRVFDPNLEHPRLP